MKLLELYLHANLYILFFWVFYRLLLKNSTLFRGQRAFILSSLSVGLFIPFLHSGFNSLLISSQTAIQSINPVNIIYKITDLSRIGESLKETGGAIEWNQLVFILILSGSIISTFYFLYNHIKINLLIKHSPSYSKDNFRIILPHIDIVPFIYNNKIFISRSTPAEDREMIIGHEIQHYKFRHHLDNYLLQIFQIIFWLNPAFYLFKKELKLIHEYQVDNHLINSNIDETQYKLVLIKLRAGHQKFAMAIGLNNCRIKNRIIMMNTRKTQKGKWKFFLLVPALCIAFLSLSSTNFSKESHSPTASESQVNDSVEIEIINLPEEFRISDPKDAVLVLMNKVSDVAIDGKFAKEGNRVNMLISNYNKLREDLFFKNLKPDVKIITMKDMATDEKDYKALLDEISTAIYTMHNNWSDDLFGKPFKELNDEQQGKILKMVPPKIYYAPPKSVKPKPKK